MLRQQKKASAPCVKARQDDLIEGICSPGSLGPNPGRIQLDRPILMLHSYQMEMSSLTFHTIFTILTKF